MNNIMRNILAGATGAALAISGVAFAASDTMTGNSMHGDAMPSSMMMMHPPAPMVLTVSGSGKGLLRGVVASVNATSITVAAWGGIWTINTDSNTTILPSGKSLSDIKVGDYVGAMGMVSEDNPTMTASLIRDWTAKSAMMHGSMMGTDHMMASTTGQ